MKKTVVVLVFCLLSRMALAIGDSCAVAIPMPYSANSVMNGNFLAGNMQWFAFVPQTSEVNIKLTNTNPVVGHIHDLILLEGVCHPKYYVIGSDSRSDTVLKIHMHDLLVGVPYFILVMRDRNDCVKCGTPGAPFDLQVQSQTPPAYTTVNGFTYLNGVPSHVKNQIVLRINKLYLKMNAINNINQQDKPMTVFVDPATIQNMANTIFNGDNVGLGQIHLKKMYPNLTANDSISISRQGEQIHIPDFWETFILTIPDTMPIFRTCRALSSINGIRYAEPNYVLVPCDVPNDPYYSTFQSNLHSTIAWSNANINAEGAWDVEKGKSFVRVGVYDTGIDQTHSELSGGKVVDGFNYYSNSALVGTSNDSDEHGTACSGIIGAYRNNGSQIAGIAGGDIAASNPGCSLVDAKIALGTSTFATIPTISNAILTGALNTPAGFGLHVMNHSWTSQGPSILSLHDAVQNADQNGVVVVAARGNYPDITPIDKLTLPACYQDEMVVCVGASGTNGEWKTNGNGDPSDLLDDAYQSMIKNNVDLVAPGTQTLVRTTRANNNGFRTFNGTSAATPHVSGVAALMISQVDQPVSTLSNLAIEDVEQILQMSAIDNVIAPCTPGPDVYSGYGLLNATAALNMVYTPKYKIQHFGVGQNASSSISSNKIFTQKQIVLVNPYGSLAAGTYFADVYENTITLNYSLSSPNDVIITSWPRFSSSFGWSASNPQSPDNFCQVVSASPNQAVLKTWTYNFRYDQNGNVLVDPWYPTRYFPKAALSIYTYDKTFVGINEVSSDGTQLYNVFPNPSNNNTTITFTLLDTKNVDLSLYDAQGKLVKSIEIGRVSKGTHIYDVSVSEMSEGIYFCRLMTDGASCGKKLVVSK